jgi:DNA mismatch endonuclease (patch repair protein)
MSRIRGINTRPEVRLRQELWRRGVRYRVNPRLPFGKPDLALLGRRVAIFIDGCFWHGCPEHYFAPRTRRAFWAQKLRENVERDRRQVADAERLGWTVLRVWEHEVRLSPAHTARALLESMAGGETPEEWRVYAVSSSSDGREQRRLVDLRTGRRRRSMRPPRHPPSAQSLA